MVVETDHQWSMKDIGHELSELAQTAGANVVGIIEQQRDKPHPAFFVGTGKLEEIRKDISFYDANLVVFSGSLSPAQQRNLERELDVRVIDRTQLILDIFAQRARTREGKLQVELAQLTYLLPRLTGKGQALSRLAGGIGTRGPGETKLEADRRRIRKRITDLKNDIEEVKKTRKIQRSGQKHNLPLIALVGYTNAGKSTLLQTLMHMTQPDKQEQVYIANQLFATLDPLMRLISIKGHDSFLITDTVGFIRDLPPTLIAAFKATLEVIQEADILLHVVDGSEENLDLHLAATREVLEDLKVINKPTITVLNKADLGSMPSSRGIENPVQISALNQIGIHQLLTMIDTLLLESKEKGTWLIPYQEMQLVDFLHQHGQVINSEYTPEGILIKGEIEKRKSKNLHQYTILEHINREERH